MNEKFKSIIKYLFTGITAIIISFTAFDFSSRISFSKQLNNINNVSINQSKPISKQDLLKYNQNDFFLGSKDAKNILIEYSSLSCPHCSKFHNEILDKLINNEIKDGKLLYIYRPLPTSASAMDGVMIAYCNHHRYFEILKTMFKTQNSWAFDTDYKSKLFEILALKGISKESFDKCLLNINQREKLTQDSYDTFNILKIENTPTFFVNGKKIEGASFSYETLQKIIQNK